MPSWWPWKKKNVEPPARPQVGEFVSGNRSDYEINSSLRSLTPAKLATAMRSAETGDTSDQYEVFEIVEQDPHVLSLYQRRRKAVIKNKLVISPWKADDTRAQASSDLCNEIIYGTEGEGGIRNWRPALYDLTDAIGKGFALLQIVWDQDGSRWFPRELKRWPQRLTILGDPNAQYKQDEDDIRIITDAHMSDGEILEPYQWIAHVQKSWSTPLARAGMFRAITWFYLFKHFSWKDWAMFLERYGMPYRVGKYAPSTDDAEKQAMLSALERIGKDGYCIMPQLSTLELLEASGVSSGEAMPHQNMIDYCNDEISKAIMGNTMANTQGDRGARSAKEAFTADEDDTSVDDALLLAETIRQDLLTPIVRFNMGDAPIPKCEFQSEKSENLDLKAVRDRVLVKEIGVKVSPKYFYETYDLPEPEGDEDVIGGTLKPSPAEIVPPSETQEAYEKTFVKDVLALADVKKKSVDWVISRMLSKEESDE